MESDKIISDDSDIAEVTNEFFTNVVDSLGIEGFPTKYFDYNFEIDHIANIISKFKERPSILKFKERPSILKFKERLSILKIKDKINIEEPFNFSISPEADNTANIKALDVKKPTTFTNISARILTENYDIISPHLTTIYNESKSNCTFPKTLKFAEIIPAHKKDDTAKKDNYRPISILPSISKVFEKNIFDQISLYIDSLLSPFYVALEKVTVHNIVLLSCWNIVKKHWITVN